ncbi:MAG: MFS transporter [Flavobacteriales bacterium]|nr:MFS transporter [Flavobacteriales bacterium]
MHAWAMYDWANSVYNLVITTAIFPIFYAAQTSFTDKNSGKIVDTVSFLGQKFSNTELYNYVFSLAYLIVVFTAPILSGVADYSGKKKFFLKFFCYLGSFSCMGLYFFDGQHLELSMVPVVLACVGFWGSLVFYNAFLPEIADPEYHDSLSARGFMLGYIGSTLVLVCSLIAIKMLDVNARYIFVIVGLWWMGFAQYTYKRLNESYVKKEIKNPLMNGFLELKKVAKELRGHYLLRKYLISYFVYNCGVQTVLIVAVPFANKEIFRGDDKSGLIVSVIIIQIVAAVGAWTMSKLSSKIGNFNVIKATVFIWMLACILAYFITEPLEFYFLAAMVGFIMGGIQSMSRSTFAKLLPSTTDHASYFSFYDVSEKIGLVIGVFLFGYIEGITHDMRQSILLLISLFAIGFLLLMRIRRSEYLINKIQNIDERIHSFEA